MSRKRKPTPKDSQLLLREDYVSRVAKRFKASLPQLPAAPQPQQVLSERNPALNPLPAAQLSERAIHEFIEAVGEALADLRAVKLRGIGKLTPKRHHPMRVRVPGADPDDESAWRLIPMRVGVHYRAPPTLSKEIRARDEEHGVPEHLADLAAALDGPPGEEGGEDGEPEHAQRARREGRDSPGKP